MSESSQPTQSTRDSVPTKKRSVGELIGIALRGALMGIAEVIPGVSGGTIAFISGIYDELLSSIARFGPASIGELFSAGLPRFWQSHNLTFLVTLALGMGLSLVTIARLVKAALEATPPLVWAFFFGLIVASVVYLGRSLRDSATVDSTRGSGMGGPGLLLIGAVGLALGLGLSMLAPATVEVQWWMLLVGGAIAVTAWILPGISGSLMLLLMGLYPAVLAAVSEFDLVLLGSLVAGCVIGMLAFSRLLSWLLSHYRAPVLALLTGVMAGSLIKLWPWQADTGSLLLPGQYAETVGPALLWPSAGMLLLGLLAVGVLARFNPQPDS